MKPLPRWRRLLMSTPGAIIVQALAALTIILLVYRPRHFSWANVLAISFFYGVVMTIVAKTYAQKYSKSLGLSNQQQVGMLAEAIKKAEIPANPEVERALPAFIDRRMKFIERQRRFLPFCYVLFGLGFLQSIFTRDLFEMGSFGLILGFCIYSYFYYKKTESNIAVLRAELEKRGVKLSSEAERKNKEWNQPISQARRSMWIIGAVAFLLLIALAVSSASSRNADNHTSQRNSNTKKNSVQQSAAFTASKYNFKINFPSDPSVTDEKIEASKDNPLPIPYTSYSVSANNDSQVYSIVAYNWPKQDADFPSMSRSDLRKSLIGFADSDMQEFSGTITSIKDKYIFSGHTLAEEGQFSMPSYYGSASLGYIRVFTVGNFEYDIITTGTDKNAFENFADSFQSKESSGASRLPN